MLDHLSTLFEENGFSRMSFIQKLPYYDIELKKHSMKFTDILKFDCIYADQEIREVFVIASKLKSVFTQEEIKNCEQEIANFINFHPSNSLRFNITLILLCPLNFTKKMKKIPADILDVLGSEKDKYFCKKIFLDSTNPNAEEELSILPLVPINISVKDKANGYSGITLKLKEFMNDELFKELTKIEDEPDIEIIEKNLFIG
ncbi:hypothetical protein [Paenibacillus odorifer]|uniref:Uncharacterized protein n=1 Tax=Paenibacillus odorifer TaxID=189426 RepID=A0A1R0Y1A8_9BACL|nr:hypothetical protein [Paenibacillus odorifer]OMD41115.1 hypothetical protein BSK52_11840 [Paenibacillus odorifer]